VLAKLLHTLKSLPREARDTLFLLAVIFWVIAPHMQHLPLWCSALAVGVLIWRGTLALQSKPLPSKWILLATLLLIMLGAWWSHKSLIGRDPGVTLIVALLCLKTLELRAKRDAFVVFFLGFFTMLTNFFFSQSLIVAAAMMLALMGLLTALIHSHRMVGQPALKESLRSAGFLVLLGAPIMALLFVLFPRVAPLWGMPGETTSGRSGLSSEMSVGDMARISLDDAIAMRIKFKLAAGQQTPPQNLMYFRGPVLSQFDGRVWRPSVETSFSRRFPMPADLRTSNEMISYEVTLEPTRRPWIFVLEAATLPPKVPGHEVRMNNELQWLSNIPVSDLVRYTATSSLEFAHGPVQNIPGMQSYLDLPPGFNPRTLQLAFDIRRDPRLNRAGAELLVPEVLSRLKNGGYTYTLDPGVYGANTADEFWFDKKEGFCEHIASSFVILMRALDIPARVVTGYQGGEMNAVDGFWTVRQRDAHAWAEVWQAGEGWVRVDPTGAVSPGRIGSFSRLAAPQGALGAAFSAVIPTGLTQQLRNAWEAVNNSWNQWVLNYSQARQLDLLKNLGFQSPSWEDLGKVLAAIVTLVGLIGAAFTLWERHHLDPWLRQLSKARKLLAKAGLVSTDSTPPRTLAALALAKFGEDARGLHDWLLQFDTLRYRPQTAAVGLGSASGLATLKAALSRLEPLPPASSASSASSGAHS
jgi:protein-glutamine gamma-glutamyltransferase